DRSVDSVRLLLEQIRYGRRNRHSCPCFVIDRESAEMFFLTEAIHQALRVALCSAFAERLHAVLQAFAQGIGAVNQFSPQNALLRADLISRKQQRHYSHTDDERRDQLKGGAHSSASTPAWNKRLHRGAEARPVYALPVRFDLGNVWCVALLF